MENKNTLHLEQSVVGYFLKVPALFSTLAKKNEYKSKLDSELFSDALCKAIIQILEDWFLKGVIPDRLLINNELEAKHIPGWLTDIDVLVLRAAEASKVEHYLDALFKNYQTDQFKTLCYSIKQRLEEPDLNVDRLIKYVNKGLTKLSKMSAILDLEKIDSALERYQEMLELKMTDNNRYFFPTGFVNLDRVIGGWQPNELVVIGGRPSMGKTSLLLSMALNMSSDFAIKVGFLTLELNTNQILERLISTKSEMPIAKIKKGLLEPYEYDIIKEQINKLKLAELFISEVPGNSLTELSKIIKKAVEEKHISVIMIDYLQLIDPTYSRTGNRESGISEVMRTLRRLTKQLNITIIVSSQLSRAVESRGGDKRPILSDLRESGSIEQDSDKVVFLHRPEYYGLTEDADGNDIRGLAELIIAKNRLGPTEVVKLRFRGQFMRFSDFELVDNPLFTSIRKDEFDAGDKL